MKRPNGILLIVAPHVGAWIEMSKPLLSCQSSLVAPHVGAWIEIEKLGEVVQYPTVAPHVGAWIEIQCHPIRRRPCASHPTWVRGLKSKHRKTLTITNVVAPHVGAWIEIVPSWESVMGTTSHPTWVRGLKSLPLRQKPVRHRRTPRGCVD